MNRDVFPLRILNEGGATRLSLVKDAREGKYFVEKRLIVDIDFQRRLFENEIDVHSSLHYRHIIHFVRRTADDSFLMEYAAKGNLTMLLARGARSPGLHAALGGFLKGLAYLHGRGYAHNDIKPSNILLTEERTKLADFAFAGRIGQVTFPAPPGYSMMGTDIYAPPDRSLPRRNSIQDDLYACGIVLYQAFSGSGRPEGIELSKISDARAREIVATCLRGGYASVEALRSEVHALLGGEHDGAPAAAPPREGSDGPLE